MGCTLEDILADFPSDDDEDFDEVFYLTATSTSHPLKGLILSDYYFFFFFL